MNKYDFVVDIKTKIIYEVFYQNTILLSFLDYKICIDN